MKTILKMEREDLLHLHPESITHTLTQDELIHIASTLGAFWRYDYNAAQKERVGMHAELKSGLHSNGFFVSRILLSHQNILEILARQIVTRLRQMVVGIDYVAGVPNGAISLGERIAAHMSAKSAEMHKTDDGDIKLVTNIPPKSRLLLVEDFCTRGTGFAEAVREVHHVAPHVRIFPWNICIINRGGMKTIDVEYVGEFNILPIADIRIQDWDPNVHCPLCKMGSKPIKPKATDENWIRLTTSQFA